MPRLTLSRLEKRGGSVFGRQRHSGFYHRRCLHPNFHIFGRPLRRHSKLSTHPGRVLRFALVFFHFVGGRGLCGLQTDGICARQETEFGVESMV